MIKASIGALALTLIATPALADVKTYFSPDVLEVGQQARWVFESDDGRIALPDLSVGGLEIVGRSQSQSMRIINGQASSSHRIDLTVIPTKQGELRIPSLELRAGQQQVSTSPITVTVNPSSGLRAPRSPQARNPWGRFLPRRQPAPAPSDDDVADAPVAFLRLIGPKRDLTVGEKTPIRVDAWFRGATSVTMKKPPSFDTDAFVIDKLSAEPVERQEMKDGQPYTVLSWRGEVSAVKEGRHELSVEMPVHLQWRELDRNRRRRRAADPFARMDALMDKMMSGQGLGAMDMFDDMFDGAGFATLGKRRETELTLRARRTEIEVAAPPETGRPEGYDGLVGRYDIESSVDRRSVRVGEPVTLSLRITGDALDRVPVVSVPDSDDFKAYRPQSRREGDAVIIEQPLIAKRAGRLEIPPVSLPSYDPATQSYVDAQSGAIAINVAPSAEPEAVVEAEDNAQKTQNAYPLIRRDARFQWITGGLWSAGLLFVLFAGLRRYRGRTGEQRADESKLADLRRKARRADDPSSFASAALQYVRAVLAKRWDMEAEAITPYDLEQRCPRAERIKALFHWEESLRYGGGGQAAPDLQTWWDDIEAELAHMEDKS